MKYFKDFINILGAYFRMIAYLFRLNPIHLIGILIATLVIALIPFGSAYVISLLIDNLISNNTVLNENIKIFIGIWIGLLILKNLISKLHEYLNMKIIMNFGREFDNDVTKKFAYLDLEYYEDPNINTLLEKVRVAYAGSPLDFVNHSFKMLGHLIKIISAITILAVFSPWFIFLLIISTIPQFVNSLIFGKNLWYIWSAKEELTKNYRGTRKYLHDYKYLPEIVVFGIRDFLLKTLKKLHKEFQTETEKHTTKKIFIGIGLDIFKVIGLATPFVILVLNVTKNIISIGTFNFYFSSINQLQTASEEFFNALANIYNSGLYVVDIFKFLDLPKKIENGTIKLKKLDTPPTIKLEDISFKYPLTKKEILSDFNLDIKPGEHIAIVGENGAGKTTLIKLLMRFYNIDSGKILINDNELNQLDINSWYKNVGTLFQEFNKYHYDVKTNIGLGDIDNIKNSQKIIEASKQAGADEFIQKFDKKYDQILNRVFDGGIDLSGGQWQKVAIARAFFKNPPILILDEPTSAIDPKAEAELFKKIFEFTKGKTVIIVSHRFSTVRNASRILVMDQGKIVEEGTHEDLMKIKKGRYKTAFEIQKKGYE